MTMLKQKQQRIDDLEGLLLWIISDVLTDDQVTQVRRRHSEE